MRVGDLQEAQVAAATSLLVICSLTPGVEAGQLGVVACAAVGEALRRATDITGGAS